MLVDTTDWRGAIYVEIFHLVIKLVQGSPELERPYQQGINCTKFIRTEFTENQVFLGSF